MRYIDTGSRNPEHALGSWLIANTTAAESLEELRWQTGFFNADWLGVLSPTMGELRRGDHVLHVLVGSNDGMTRRADVRTLMDIAGPPRPRQRIGVVSFSSGYFHPKTVHIVRRDGTAAAYVGSANLTKNGVTSLHVEAGMLLDTREGDDPDVLDEIANAIDWWFAAPRQGLTLLTGDADLDALVESGILNVPPPPPAPVAPAKTRTPHGAQLGNLIEIAAPALVTRPRAAIPAPSPPAPSPPADSDPSRYTFNARHGRTRPSDTVSPTADCALVEIPNAIRRATKSDRQSERQHHVGPSRPPD